MIANDGTFHWYIIEIIINIINYYITVFQTIFTYAGIVDEDYTDRRKYKIKFAFNGETNGSVTISCDNAEEIGFELNKDVTPSFRISSSMDDAKPYLEHNQS